MKMSACTCPLFELCTLSQFELIQFNSCNWESMLLEWASVWACFAVATRGGALAFVSFTYYTIGKKIIVERVIHAMLEWTTILIVVLFNRDFALNKYDLISFIVE